VLSYRVEEHPSAWILRLERDLTTTDDRELRKLFVEMVREGKVKVLLDMRQVTFLDSVMLGTLVWGMKNLREAGGDLRLFGLGEFARHLFSITQLERAFRISPDEATALRDFA
jgi:anti-sigma B factor antagonist